MPIVKAMGSVRFLFLLLLLPTGASAWEEVAQSFTLDGRLFDSATPTDPLLDAGTIKIQILSQDQLCILYEEDQPFNTTASNGYFNIRVGTDVTSLLRTASDRGNTMYRVFANTGADIDGKLAADGTTNCTYDADVGHVRKVRVKITPSDLVVRTLSPDMTLDSVPSAVVAESAESVQGLARANILEINTVVPLTQANVENIFSAVNYPLLTALLGGTSSNYVQTNANGAGLPNIAGDPVAPATGQIWYDTTLNQIRYKDNTATIRTLGITGVALVEADIPTLTTAGKVSGSAINTGTITGNTIISTTGSVSSASSSTRILDIYDSDNTNFVRFQTPATGVLTSDYTLTLPSDAGTPGYYMTTNGSGTLTWSAPPQCLASEKLQVTAGPAISWSCVADVDTNNTDHGTLAGLGDDDHGQYTMNAGRAGGQNIRGGTASGDDVTIESTSDATKGFVILQPNGGNVGIGTTNPSSELQVIGSINATYRVLGGGTQIGSYGAGQAAVYPANNADIYFTDNSQASVSMVIKTSSTGNVGVGTITPGLTTGVGATVLSINGSTGSGRLELSSSQADADGNLLGTIQYSDPNNPSVTDKRIAQILGQVSGTTATNRGGKLRFMTRDDGGVGPIDRMTIDNVGNVGIGTSSPEAPLDVNGAVYARGGLNVLGTAWPNSAVTLQTPDFTTGFGALYGSGTQAGFTANLNLTTSYNWAPLILQTNGGNVGIGTASPNAKLTVEGAMSLDQMGADHAGAAGYGSLYVKTDGRLYYRDGTGTITDMLSLGSSGEANTASNVTGGSGVGIWKQKAGPDLEFKSLLPGSTKLSVSGGVSDVTLDVVETNINHDNLLGFVSNEHIDHSGVSIATAANSGLSGGGTIAATRNLAVDITGSTAETVPASGDEILVYDTSATALRKMTRANFLTGYLAASIGTSAGNVMGADAVPPCTPEEKLVMSAGPTFTWSCQPNSVVADDDGDTKIQMEESADEDKIRFDTAGTERMIIDQLGNVGVGTTGPVSRMTVRGPAGVDYTSFTGTTRLGLTVEGAANGAGADLSGIDFQWNGSTNPVARIAAEFDGGGISLFFGTSNNSSNGVTNRALAISPQGRVGVNNWPSLATLEVTKSGTDPIFRVTNSTSGDFMTVANNGNIGMGATIPDDRLHIAGGQMRIDNDTNTTNKGCIRFSGTALEFSHDCTAFSVFSTSVVGGWTDAGTNVHLTTSTDKVGIGTTTPATELQVISTSVTDERGIMSTSIANTTNGAAFIGRKTRGTPGAITAIANGDSIAGLIAQPYDGAAYQFTGWAGFVSNGVVAGNSVPTDFTINTGATAWGGERLRISSAGNVGIGTTTPNAKLSIGNNVATGFLDSYAEYQAILFDGGTAPPSYGLGVKGSTMVFNSGAGAYSFDRGGAATTLAMDTAGNSTFNGNIVSTGTIYSTGGMFEAQNGGEPGIAMHRPGLFATYMKLRGDNNVWFGGWSVADGAASLVAGNYYVNQPGGGWLWNGLMNQAVMTTSTPTFGNVYITGLGWLFNGILNQSVMTNAAPTFAGLYAGVPVSAADRYVCNVNGTFQFTRNGAGCGTSDIRLKRNIEDFTPGLDEILQLRPVSYDFIPERGGDHDFGMVAQEVQPIIPELVVPVGEKDYLTINYIKMVLPLINAVKDLYNKYIVPMTTQLADHDRRVQSLEKENKELKNALCAKDPTYAFCKDQN